MGAVNAGLNEVQAELSTLGDVALQSILTLKFGDFKNQLGNVLDAVGDLIDSVLETAGAIGQTYVDGLTNGTKLTSLHLSKRLNVKPKPSPVHMTTREQVVAYQERIKKAMK